MRPPASLVQGSHRLTLVGRELRTEVAIGEIKFSSQLPAPMRCKKTELSRVYRGKLRNGPPPRAVFSYLRVRAVIAQR
jgi:hypothetical protein